MFTETAIRWPPVELVLAFLVRLPVPCGRAWLGKATFARCIRDLVSSRCNELPFSLCSSVDFRHPTISFVLQYWCSFFKKLEGALQWKSFKIWHCRPAAASQGVTQAGRHLVRCPPHHRRAPKLPSLRARYIVSAVCLSLSLSPPSSN